MRKLDMLARRAYVKTACAVRTFLFDEEGDVNVVSMVILIGVAVLLAIVFKDQIKGLIDTLMGEINGTASNAVTQAP